jgi:hypothetical protein
MIVSHKLFYSRFGSTLDDTIYALVLFPTASVSLEVWVSEESWGLLAEMCPCGLDFFVPRLLALFLALDKVCRGGVCCRSMLRLCHVIITGTVICTDTDGKDVACAG